MLEKFKEHVQNIIIIFYLILNVSILFFYR